MAIGRTVVKCLLQATASSGHRGTSLLVKIKAVKRGAQIHSISAEHFTSSTQSIHKRYLCSNVKDDQALKDNETHGQPLHRFGSSVKRESAANRFDADQTQSSTTEYQRDVPIDPDVDVYNHTPSVNLSACMQSQVPEPYGKGPTHMNMPEGVTRREDKYVQGQISSLSSKREYSTTARSPKPALDEHGNATYMTVDEIMEAPCPQGVQGDDCEQFKLWLSNCLEFGTNAECEKLANEYIAGRKTLAQIFEEYEIQIKQCSPAKNKYLHVPVSSTSVETASTFVVAYGVHKIFAPVRIGITLTCAPLIVRSLRARGILKAPKA